MTPPYIVGVVHARGGSKRLPLKNIKLLGGIPLVGWIVKAAHASGRLDRLLVSSDHPEIIRVAKEYGAEAPFVRPADISEDVPSELVTQHAIRFVEEQEKRKVDIAITFQPTTPFCSPEDISACIDVLLRHDDLESAFTARAVHERPEWMFRPKGHRAELFVGGNLQGERGVIQLLEPLYMPNGAAYATRRETLFKKNCLVSPKTGIHVMPAERSIDIDEPVDFLLAEVVVQEMKTGFTERKLT